jgi:hypothetical protein
MACIIDSCVPTHSNTESTPSSVCHVAALRHESVATEFAGELLPRRVTAHLGLPEFLVHRLDI